MNCGGGGFNTFRGKYRGKHDGAPFVRKVLYSLIPNSEFITPTKLLFVLADERRSSIFQNGDFVLIL